MKFPLAILLAAFLFCACVQAPQNPAPQQPPSQPQIATDKDWNDAAPLVAAESDTPPLPPTQGNPQAPHTASNGTPPAPPQNLPNGQANNALAQPPAQTDSSAILLPDGFYAQWLGLMRQKNYATATVLATGQIGLQPGNSSLYVLRSISFLAQNDTFHALPDAQKAVSLSSESAFARAALGHAHYALYASPKPPQDSAAHYIAAESNYTKAASLSWWDAPSHAGLALLYLKAGKGSEVALEYSRAMNANRSLLSAPLGLVAEYAGRQNNGNLYMSYNLAYRDYVELYNYLPPSRMPNLNLDVPSKDVGSYSTPEGRAKYPDYISLGDAYAYNKNYSHAAYWYRQAKLSDPFSPVPYAKLSLVYWKMGKGEMAKSEAEQALKYEPEGELSNFAASLVEGDDVKFLQRMQLLAAKNPGSFDYCIGLADAYNENAQYDRRDKQYDACRNLLLSDYFPFFMYEKI